LTFVVHINEIASEYEEIIIRDCA